ncbi:hypothetical protein QFZ81_003971 [Paenibacillus sp. V4I9]|nr:hypothetical protein [Paenibacillus sp. V4I9]MDQ0888883.1 hypothetical protein [Paenibacillus sp. V4I9]
MSEIKLNDLIRLQLSVERRQFEYVITLTVNESSIVIRRRLPTA